MGIGALSSLGTDLYSNIQVKATSLAHAACNKFDLADAKDVYELTVTALNLVADDLTSKISQYKPGSEEYNQILQKAHNIYSGYLESLRGAETQLMNCHVDPNSLGTQLTPLAYEIATIPEFGAVAGAVSAASMSGIVLYTARDKIVNGIRSLQERYKTRLNKKRE